MVLFPVAMAPNLSNQERDTTHPAEKSGQSTRPAPGSIYADAPLRGEVRRFQPLALGPMQGHKLHALVVLLPAKDRSLGLHLFAACSLSPGELLCLIALTRGGLECFAGAPAFRSLILRLLNGW
jgi:hypothetical protein